MSALRAPTRAPALSCPLALHAAFPPNREKVIAEKKVLLFKEMCEDAGIIGTPFYVMDFINGRIVEDHACAGQGC